MKLANSEKSFIESNKIIIEGLIKKRLDDFNFTSINAPTIEEREKARLLALEFQSYLGIINDLFKKATKKKRDFTGI